MKKNEEKIKIMPELYSLPKQNLVGYDFVFIHKHASK